MKVKLYLHGHLRNKVQKDFVEMEATTVKDALQNFEYRYRKVLKAPLDIGRWRIKIKDFDTQESWTVPLFVDELHIYPDFRMGKSARQGGLVQMVIGVALVVVGAVATAFGGGAVGIPLMLSGVSMFVQGAYSYFFAPRIDTNSTDSKYLAVPGNTVAAGTRIPFGYGLFKVAGHYLSYNVISTLYKDIDILENLNIKDVGYDESVQD